MVKCSGTFNRHGQKNGNSLSTTSSPAIEGLQTRTELLRVLREGDSLSLQSRLGKYPFSASAVQIPAANLRSGGAWPRVPTGDGQVLFTSTSWGQKLPSATGRDQGFCRLEAIFLYLIRNETVRPWKQVEIFFFFSIEKHPCSLMLILDLFPERYILDIFPESLSCHVQFLLMTFMDMRKRIRPPHLQSKIEPGT